MKHTPVLMNEVLRLMEPKAGGSYLDCTFGGGGHSTALLEAEPGLRLTAMDRDPQVLERSKPVSARFANRFCFVDGNFSTLDRVPGAPFDGILMDIGVSSFQLDEAERGFSFRQDAPVDMRMDTRSGISAAEFLETASPEALVEAIRDFGEEPCWKKVVQAIQDARGTGMLARTVSFSAIIEKAARDKRPGPPSRIHPATRVFQGIRISINNELGELKAALPKAFSLLKTEGILAVISFHSLEDRIVKRFFNEVCGRPVDSRDSRTQDMREKRAELLTRKPISASDEELDANPRSRSAKLRAVKKL